MTQARIREVVNTLRLRDPKEDRKEKTQIRNGFVALAVTAANPRSAS